MATLHQKLSLLRGLWNGERAFTGPMYVTLDMTSRCNLNCIGCQYHSPLLENHSPPSIRGGHLNTAVYEKLLDSLHNLRTDNLIVQGSGEPLLHPDIFGMLSSAKSKGFKITLITNGTLLNEAAIKKLVAIGVDRVRVSLWASNRDEYRRNYPGMDPGGLERVLSSLKTFASVKAAANSAYPEVIPYFLINRVTQHSIESMFDIALQSGCNGMHTGIMYSHGGIVDDSGLVLNSSELAAVRRTLSTVGKKLRTMCMTENIANALAKADQTTPVWTFMPCYIGWFQATVRNTGTVHPCCRCDRDFSFGDLTAHSFEDIWNGQRVMEFRRQMLSPERARLLRSQCDCTHCCHLNHMQRIHKIFKVMHSLRRHDG